MKSAEPLVLTIANVAGNGTHIHVNATAGPYDLAQTCITVSPALARAAGLIADTPTKPNRAQRRKRHK